MRQARIRRNNGKTKAVQPSARPAIVWSLTIMLVAFAAFELANLLESSPAPMNEVMTEEGDRGTLVLKTEGDHCERMKYDALGRVVEQLRPCSNADLNLDDHGRPLPIGTMQRLDAISNSFQRRN